MGPPNSKLQDNLDTLIPVPVLSLKDLKPEPLLHSIPKTIWSKNATQVSCIYSVLLIKIQNVERKLLLSLSKDTP